MDFTGFAAFIYRSVEAEHDRLARRATWLQRLRDLQRLDRERAKRPQPEALRAQQPLKAHSPWI